MTCSQSWTDLVGCFPPGAHHCDLSHVGTRGDWHQCACGSDTYRTVDYHDADELLGRLPHLSPLTISAVDVLRIARVAPSGTHT